MSATHAQLWHAVGAAAEQLRLLIINSSDYLRGSFLRFRLLARRSRLMVDEESSIGLGVEEFVNAVGLADDEGLSQLLLYPESG